MNGKGDFEMTIGTISKQGIENGDCVIIANKKECQLIVEIVAEYCRINPKKKNARDLLKQFESDLQCY